MILFSILKIIFLQILITIAICILIIYLPNLPPDIEISKSITITPALPLTGKLALNEKLANAEILHKGNLIGPESFADYNGELYTGLHSGEIVKLSSVKPQTIIDLSKVCKSDSSQDKCGRALGLTIDKNGILYALDAFQGLYEINLKTLEKTLLISPESEIEGTQAKCLFFNSLSLAENGDIYWSCSSTKANMADIVYEFLADPSGTLVHYNAKTKKNKVLIDGLQFANGVGLSKNEDFVIVSETGRSRILRYHLKGPKKDTWDVFIDGLPGTPDNIKPDGADGFLVALVMARNADTPQLTEKFAQYPLVRKLLARIMGLVELGFNTINRIYPNEITRNGKGIVQDFVLGAMLSMNKRVNIVQLSKNGEILDSLFSTEGKIQHITEGYIFREHLYLGSFVNDYVARVGLKDVGWGHLVKKNVETTEKKKNVKTEEH